MSEAKQVKVLANTRKRETTLLRNVYGLMSIGLLITAAVAYAASSSQTILSLTLSPMGLLVLVVVQFGLVFALSSRTERMGVGAALGCFILYSAVTGLTLSVIFLAYTSAVIWKAFLTTAVMFVGMTVYANFSKADIASWGRYLVMALWGLVAASLINLFMGSGTLDYIISIIGVVVFTGLTIWDSRRIIEMNREYGAEMTSEEHMKLGCVGALNLYLDFLNIFLYLLRIYAASDRN